MFGTAARQSYRAIAVAVAMLFAFAPAAVAGPALLFEAGSGKVLYAEDQDHLWHPASVTKIMTAYLVFEALKAGKLTLETKIAVSEAAHIQPPSKIGLPVGGEMTVDLALKALVIKSANDVAVMLAEAVGGSEAQFVERMNTTARRLGMTRTRFLNPHGLPATEQVTTARDLGRLARAVLRDFPEQAAIWGLPEMRIGKRRIATHNSLLKTYEGADGMKTGFICDSGYNVVASATRDGRQLVAVVLGEISGRDRAVRASSLLEHGFQMSGWKTLFNTSTLETLPLAEDAKGATSIRETVSAWACGNRAKVRAVASAKVKAAAKGKAAAKVGGKAEPAAAGAQATAGPKPVPKKPTPAKTGSTTPPTGAEAQAGTGKPVAAAAPAAETAPPKPR